MKKLAFYIYVFIILIAISSCSSVKETNFFQESKTDITSKIDSILVSDSLLLNANFGIAVKSVKSGEIIYEKNSNKMFNPASNVKIITAFSALNELDSNFKYETRLYTNGKIKNGVLYGDLYIWSNGDPTFYSRFFDSSTVVFHRFAKELKDKGIKEIKGSVIADGTAFDNNTIGFGWGFDDLLYWYAAQVTPLQINENYIDFKINPLLRNSRSLVQPNIISPSIKIIENFEFVDSINLNNPLRDRIKVKKNSFCDDEIVFSGKIYQNDTTEIDISVALSNPNLFYAEVFTEVLRKNDIKVEQKPKCILDTAEIKVARKDTTVLILYRSFSFVDILKQMMKVSHNLYAETMIKTIGYIRENNGSFNAGKKYCEEQLQSIGINKNTYRYVDGSGLSRLNYFSPLQFLTVLESALLSKDKNKWLDLFPISGIDGTLKNRMKGTIAEGKIKAKTGTLSNVRALSGYICDSNGEPVFIFSIIWNGYLTPVANVDAIIDKILIYLIQEFEIK